MQYFQYNESGCFLYAGDRIRVRVGIQDFRGQVIQFGRKVEIQNNQYYTTCYAFLQTDETQPRLPNVERIKFRKKSCVDWIICDVQKRGTKNRILVRIVSPGDIMNVPSKRIRPRAIALRHKLTGINILELVLKTKKLLTQYQIGATNTSFGSNPAFSTQDCGSAQYPGSYVNVYWESNVNPNVKLDRMPLKEDDFVLVFCPSMINQYDWHYNSHDSNGYQNTQNWQYENNYTVYKRDWKRFLNDEINVPPSDDNELIFHEPVDFAPYLVEIWHSQNIDIKTRREAREILDENGFGNVQFRSVHIKYDRSLKKNYRCRSQPAWKNEKKNTNCFCLPEQSGGGRKPQLMNQQLFNQQATECSIDLPPGEVKTAKDFNRLVGRRVETVLDSLNPKVTLLPETDRARARRLEKEAAEADDVFDLDEDEDLETDKLIQQLQEAMTRLSV